MYLLATVDSISRSYWLFKSEPQEFSYADLAGAPDSTARWDGIRNYQARNFLRDEVKKGDWVFIYHSSIKEPGVFGLGEIVSEQPYADPTALDARSPYFDPVSFNKGISRWVSVDVKAIAPFKNSVLLREIKASPAMKDFLLLKKGNRLSVFPVMENYAKWILAQGKPDF